MHSSLLVDNTAITSDDNNIDLAGNQNLVGLGGQALLKDNGELHTTFAQALIWNDDFEVTASTYSNGTVTISMLGSTNHTYQLQFSDHLSDNAWNNIGSGQTAPSSGAIDINDPGPMPSRRIYGLTE